MADEQAEEKVEEISLEEKAEKVRAVDALRRAGYSVTDACRLVGIPKSTYYKWKQEVGGQEGEENDTEASNVNAPKEVATAYELLRNYGVSRADTAQAQRQEADPVEALMDMKKKLEKARAILGSTEGANVGGSEELSEIKKAIAYLAQKIEELQRGQVYMGRVKKVQYPDGTVVEYDYAPRDSVLIKQADTVYGTVVPHIIDELKGIRQDLTVFANRLLGLIEVNLAQEIKKAPGFFPLFRRRTKEERERELEELNKMLDMRINVNEVAGNEVPVSNVGERRSGQNDNGGEPSGQTGRKVQGRLH